jgi:hypothetical protein
VYIISNQELHSQLLQFLADHRRRTGARVLTALLANPGIPLTVMEIAFRIYKYDRTPWELEAIAKNAFRPIPFSDKRAQAMYIERLKLLRAQKKAGDGRVDWEIGCLAKELRRITTPTGAIKNEYPEMKKAYHCFKMSLNRLIARAERLGQPELADYIRAHLRTGIWCCWYSEVKKPKRRARKKTGKNPPVIQSDMLQ